MANQENVFLRNRLTGAIFWMLLLIIIVPVWYSNPVNFQPEGFVEEELEVKNVVNKVFKIPEHDQIKNKKSLTKIKQVKKVEPKNKLKDNPPSWIIKIIAYKDKQKALDLQKNLKNDFETKIKFFPSSKYYSLRSGPYLKQEEALKDQKKINKLLRVESIITKL